MNDKCNNDNAKPMLLDDYGPPVAITKIHNVSNLRRIDENLLNSFVGTLPNDVIANLMRKQLPMPNSRRPYLVVDSAANMPDRVRDIVIALKLLDEQCMDRRAELVLGYCRYMNYSYNTTVKYFNTLKRDGMFGKGTALTNIRADRLAFADSGRAHIRIVRMADFQKFLKHLHDKFSRYTAPILMAAYTGLRSSEVLQTNTYTLYQLRAHLTSISIKRKHTVVTPNSQVTYWTPIYNVYLNTFINALINLYSDQYDAFRARGINTAIFNVTVKTLANRIRTLYTEAVGALPPHGFGVHSCRNMVAMMMAQNSDNMVAISSFLQHKSMKFTRRYIQADFTHVTREFNRLTNYELSNVRSELDTIVDNMKLPNVQQPPGKTTTKKI